jgi:perosamine synthetase
MIPFAKPRFSKEDLDEIGRGIRKVLASGWLTSGPSVQELESNFSEVTRARFCVAVNSGTAALHCIMVAIGIKPGDEVILPSASFVASANAVHYAGGKPVFADSDESTFNISPSDVEKKITRKTKAIMAVHLGGNPCDMHELQGIARDAGLRLVEDCAHAHGASVKGQPCGTFGVAGAYSLYPTKVVTAGEGGMIVTNDAELARKCRVLRNQGRAGYGPKEIQAIGYNYRMSDVLAEVARVQLKHLGEFVAQRNRIASLYRAELASIPWVRPQEVLSGNVSSYYAYIVSLWKPPIPRDQIAKILSEGGIQTSVLYHPIHLQPVYRKIFGYRRGLLPVAEALGSSSLALPMFSGMTAAQVRSVARALAGVERKRTK